MSSDFRRLQTNSYELRQIQDNVNDAIAPLLRAPYSSGSYLTGVSVGTTVNNVTHGLGRSYRGYLILRQEADTTVYVDTTSTADSSVTIPLLAGASDTVDLWVF